MLISRETMEGLEVTGKTLLEARCYTPQFVYKNQAAFHSNLGTHHMKILMGQTEIQRFS